MSPGRRGSWKGSGGFASRARSSLTGSKRSSWSKSSRPSALVSPAYDDGTTSEAETVKTFEARFARLLERFRDA